MISTKKLLTLLSLALAVSAAPKFTATGDVDFRFRGEFRKTEDAARNTLNINEYSNKLGWNARLDLEIAEDMAIYSRLSNPNGYDLETVVSNGKFTTFGDIAKLALPRLEAQWTPKNFVVGVGLLEVKGSTPLTVVRGAEESAYAKQFTLSESWTTYTNESQVGARVGYNFPAVSINAVYSINQYTKTVTGLDTVIQGIDTAIVPIITTPHSSSHSLIFDAPVTLNKDSKMAITPSFIIRTSANKTLHDRTNSYTGGVDFTTNIGDNVSLKAGAAYGGFRPTPDSDELNSGFMASVIPGVKFGINDVKVGYSFSTGHNAAAPVSLYYQHIDAAWAFNVHKNFAIAPRVRLWYNTADNSEGYDKKIRPELIFKAKF